MSEYVVGAAAHRPSVPSSLQLAIHPVNTSTLQSHPSTLLTNADRKRHGALFPDHLLAVGDTRPLACNYNKYVLVYRAKISASFRTKGLIKRIPGATRPAQLCSSDPFTHSSLIYPPAHNGFYFPPTLLYPTPFITRSAGESISALPLILPFFYFWPYNHKGLFHIFDL